MTATRTIPTLLVAAWLPLAMAACDDGERPARAPGPRAEPDRAAQLIDRWIDAAGGMDAWDRVRSARLTVVTVWFDSTETEVRRRPRFIAVRKDPQRARIERDEPEGHYVQAHDGQTAWATLDGERLQEDHPAAREVRYVTGDVFYWFGLPYKLRDPGVFLDHIPADSTGYEGVRVRFDDGVGLHPGDRYYYYFDEGSPFPVQVHYIEEGSTSVDRTVWSDYREAPPLTYVGTRTYYDERGRTTKQLLMRDVVINPEVPDSTFRPPMAAAGR